MTVYTSSKLCEPQPQIFREFNPLEHARNLKLDVERNLDLLNFQKASNIGKHGITVVDAFLKQTRRSVEIEILQAFREEFVRYVNLIIPSREADLERQKQKEKDELERQKLINARMSGPGGSTFESFYCMVEPDDYSSMYPTASEYMSPSSIRYPSIHNSTASTEESIISSKSATLSPPSMFQVPPYNTLNSTPVNANSTLQLPSHPGQNRSPQNDASRSISNDPLQFCSIDSTHCSFYDSFASFSISQHQNGASSFITGANSNHNQFSNVNIGHTNGGYGSGFQNLHHYSSITASRFPLVLENIEMSEQEEGED